jgi:hypothetical protein
VPEEGNQFYRLLFVLFENIEELAASGVIKVNETFLTCVVRYRSILALMGSFFWDMSRNNKKDTKFPHGELRQLLQETGFISDQVIQQNTTTDSESNR